MNTWMDSVVRSLQDAGLMAFVVDAGVKSLLILLVAGAVCLAWRRGPAAARHLVWFLALAGCLVVPAFSHLLPAAPRPLWVLHGYTDSANELTLTLEWAPGPQDQAAVAPAADVPKAAARLEAAAANSGQSWSARLRAGWTLAALAMWGAGVVLILGWVALGRWALVGMRRRAQVPADPEWQSLLASLCAQLRLRRRVVLLQSSAPVMPVTWGWWRPVILLPAEAASWSAQRRRVVLLHELAHVQRWDCLTQLLGRCVCALYWFNPLVWVAARQMCLEREHACDDLVLEGGCKASDYAAHLVDIASTFRPVPQVAAIAMARSSRLKTRIEAIVDGSRRRHSPPAWLLTLGAVAVLGLLAAVAAPSSQKAAADTAAGGKPWWDAQLRAFFAEKAAQAHQLAAGKTVAPEVWPYFEAGMRGDWATTTNLYVSMRQRAHQYVGTSPDERLNDCWSPILETRLAWENFACWTPKYVRAFGNDIINSIPPGSIYFGGTDPGRGVITVLCKSQVQADPFFTLTQNALADGTYLAYLRAMYGSRISIPTDEDSKQCFDEYYADAQQRLEKHQLKPGEDVRKGPDGKVNVSGQVAVMSINGLLTKVIFDHNTNREFYVEESFPLEWMYPYLSPHGLIMKLNREPLARLPEAVVQQDHDYWSRYIGGMVGNWISSDTSVADLGKFVTKVHVQHDLRGFKGGPEFLQDDFAQQAFSKLRSSLGGVYAWRATNAKTAEEKQRMTKEAEFAYQQAFALCPYSPEALFRYADLLVRANRIDDAILLAETCLKVVPPDPTAHGLVPPEISRKMQPQSVALKGLLQNLKQMKAQKK